MSMSRVSLQDSINLPTRQSHRSRRSNEHILEGFSEDYKSFVDQMEGRDILPSIIELHEKLLNHEAKLMTIAHPSFFPTTTNYVTNNRNNCPAPTQNHQQQTKPWRPSFSALGNDFKQPRPYLGKCQICGAQGHSENFLYQFQALTQQLAPTQPLIPTSIYPPSPWLPRVNFDTYTPTHLNQNPWILDSVATHHVTSDLNNLSPNQSYNGGEEVLTGNGSGLSISDIGLASLPSRYKIFS